MISCIVCRARFRSANDLRWHFCTANDAAHRARASDWLDAVLAQLEELYGAWLDPHKRA